MSAPNQVVPFPAPVGPLTPKRKKSMLAKSLTSLKARFHHLAHLSLVFGAVLSFSDVVCDLLMIIEFRNNKQVGAAIATIASLATSFFCQIFIVLLQNKKTEQGRVTARGSVRYYLHQAGGRYLSGHI